MSAHFPNSSIHPLYLCWDVHSHERWSVLKHVGDYGSPYGDTASTGELIVVRECRADKMQDGPWAVIATGFDSGPEAVTWKREHETGVRS